MELLLLILIAGVAGYFLARSRFSKPIDNTADKVAATTRDAASNVEGWFSRTFRQSKKPKEEVLEASPKPNVAVDTAEPAKPAVKQASRRKSEEPPASEAPLES